MRSRPRIRAAGGDRSGARGDAAEMSADRDDDRSAIGMGYRIGAEGWALAQDNAVAAAGLGRGDDPGCVADVDVDRAVTTGRQGAGGLRFARFVHCNPGLVGRSSSLFVECCDARGVAPIAFGLFQAQLLAA